MYELFNSLWDIIFWIICNFSLPIIVIVYLAFWYWFLIKVMDNISYLTIDVRIKRVGYALSILMAVYFVMYFFLDIPWRFYEMIGCY